MQYQGEIISIGVAILWTLTALCFEYASKRLETLSLNIIRLGMSILMLAVTLFIFTGHLYSVDAGSSAWLWLAVSGVIGYLSATIAFLAPISLSVHASGNSL
ncbi:MAG: hypothetical protein LUD02_14120 [Tannerellaceae bacterium]|nr:hypothetical protein [Tannerellaceae bacterium]MCD8265139.1 hypothetical protein [Tannerellaceae bacterium]